MITINIDLTTYVKQEVKVLSNAEQAEFYQNLINFDCLRNADKIVFTFPDTIYSITPRFLECFLLPLKKFNMNLRETVEVLSKDPNYNIARVKSEAITRIIRDHDARNW